MVLRPICLTDASELAATLRANRTFLAPWEPVRPDSYFSESGQAEAIRAAITARELGLGFAYVVTDAAGAIIGRMNINNVVRGAGQFASLGYWIAQASNGRGVGTQAVADAVAIAFTELNLHRLEAGTLVHNVASQRVLERNGFERYGLAPGLVQIVGEWQDHVLFQRLNLDWVPSGD